LVSDGNNDDKWFKFKCYDEIVLKKDAADYTRITNERPTKTTEPFEPIEPYNPDTGIEPFEPYNPETGIASNLVFIIILAATGLVLCKTKKRLK